MKERHWWMIQDREPVPPELWEMVFETRAQAEATRRNEANWGGAPRRGLRVRKCGFIDGKD